MHIATNVTGAYVRDAVIKRIEAEFPPESYLAIYQEKQISNMMFPSFAVIELDVTHVSGNTPNLATYTQAGRRAVDNHFTRSHLIEVRYHLPDSEQRIHEKCADVACMLSDILTEILDPDGVFLLGSEIVYNVVDNVLVFQVNYTYRVLRPKPVLQKYETLELDETLKE